MKNILASVLLLFVSSEIFAHALWIETNATGRKGQAQEIKVFYGEYAEFSPEKVKDWYSDVKDFTLWLVTPDGQKTKLTATAAENYFAASFTPDKDGQYTLLISHDAKDLGKTTLYQFNTSAIVTVGAAKVLSTEANSNPLKFSLQQARLNQPVALQAFFKNAPSEKVNITVFSPRGWTKELKGNSSGMAEFVPEWKGKYMIEVSRTDEAKGEHHGKEYTGIWRCATYLVDVQ